MTNYGWECPRCSKIHAPFVNSCDCYAPTFTRSDSMIFNTTTDITYINPETGALVSESEYNNMSYNQRKDLKPYNF